MDTFRIIDGPESATWTLVLAHGAGAPVDSPLLTAIAHGLAARDVRVVRFEFPYMQSRREGHPRRPPDHADVLLESWRERVQTESGRSRHLAIGGHSMGGRYATMLAADAPASHVSALVAIGYPFQPPRGGEPRIRHLAGLTAPLLIVQGTRDPFGSPDAVNGWMRGGSAELAWIPDGDHSLVPRRSSGRTREQNYGDAVLAIHRFLGRLAPHARV